MVCAIVIPFARATGSNSLSGFMETSARIFGLTSPSSAKSRVARTALISKSPSRVFAVMRPGHRRRDHPDPRGRQPHHRQRIQRRHHRPHPENLLRHRRRQKLKVQTLAHRSLAASVTLDPTFQIPPANLHCRLLSVNSHSGQEPGKARCKFRRDI